MPLSPRAQAAPRTGGDDAQAGTSGEGVRGRGGDLLRVVHAPPRLLPSSLLLTSTLLTSTLRSTSSHTPTR